MLNLTATEQNIRLAILRAIRTHRNDLVRQDVILNTVLFKLMAAELVFSFEVEAVLAAMDDAGELYHTTNFGGRRFYGIRAECPLESCQRVCRKAEEVEKVIVNAFNAFTRTERALLLARLREIVDEVSNLPE